MMDKLRHDLRAMFSRQQAELGDVQETRRRLMRAALADRDEQVGGRLHFAAGVAAVLIAAAVVATFAYIRAGAGPHLVGPVPKASPVPSAAPATPAPPSGLVIIDVDPLSASSGWILLTNCSSPMAAKCHYSVASTVNAGKTWSKAVQVGPSFDATNGDAPRSLHFVNPADGFVWGGAGGFATHDGGRTWKAIGVKAVFFAQHAVAGHGSNVWLLTEPCAKGTLCPYEVRSSVDGGRTWSAPHSLPLGASPVDVVAFGDRGLLISTMPGGDMEITLNGGVDWQHVNTKCVINTFSSMVATSDGRELWELCLDYPDVEIPNEKLFVSEDGGKSWTLRLSSQVTPYEVQQDYSTILISTRLGTALMTSIRATITLSHNSGVTWTKVGPSGITFEQLRFANATEGWALDVTQNLWATSDGGDHWSRLPAR
ncbi:MAG TPA: hypothetical protein VGF78_08065 [Candidatus Dormibacteraeota bacterium]|jgi:photosystem II stability/assembly factor-like uncharacterized protein